MFRKIFDETVCVNFSNVSFIKLYLPSKDTVNKCRVKIEFTSGVCTTFNFEDEVEATKFYDDLCRKSYLS